MILLTGSTGFIGCAVSQCLFDNMKVFKGVSRHEKKIIESESIQYVFKIDGKTDWFDVLNGVDVVVHAASKAHVKKGLDADKDLLAEYREVNVDGTLNLARQCAKNEVKRFIFISTINVNGAFTIKPFTEDDDSNPVDIFAQLKWEAEKALWKNQQETGMEVVIIRCPLVYGPNSPGNFGSLVNLVRKRIPLPLGSINNKRSLVALDNLANFIALCADYEKTPQAANQVFLISDGEDVSTSELFCRVARAYGINSCLLSVPAWFLRLIAVVLGKKEVVDRLLGSLQVDSSKARTLLGWKPVITMDKQLCKMAEADAKIAAPHRAS